MNKIILAMTTAISIFSFSISNADTNNQDGLIPYRNQINKIDNNIIKLIGERNKVVIEVGKYKKKHDMAVYAPNREAKLKIKHISMAKEHNVSPEIAVHVFDVIINHSKDLENKIS